jgi:hypothetical protein
MGSLAEKAGWLLNRAAAAIVTAALTGLIAGLVLESVLLISLVIPGSLGGAVWLLTMAVCVGAIVGVIPATLVICFSSAKVAAWRYVPRLLVGTTIGWLVCAMPFGFLYGSDLNATLGNIGSVVGPTLGALLALRFWPNPRGDAPPLQAIKNETS